MNINATGNAGIYSMQQAYRNQTAARPAMVHQEHGFCPHCQNLAMQAEKEMNVQPLGSGATHGGQAQDVWVPGVRDPQAMQQQLRDVPLPGQGRVEPQAEEAEVQPMPVFGPRANPDAADAVDAQRVPGTQSGGESLQQSPEEARQEQQVQQAVAELQQREREVIAHEQAHMTAGGHLTGGASYQFATGPDGNQYITGGEVSISMPEGNTPQETISNMDQVIRAALAPANPSPQDMAVASRAAMRQMQARVELSREQSQSQNTATEAYQRGMNLTAGNEADNQIDMYL